MANNGQIGSRFEISRFITGSLADWAFVRAKRSVSYRCSSPSSSSNISDEKPPAPTVSTLEQQNKHDVCLFYGFHPAASIPMMPEFLVQCVSDNRRKWEGIRAICLFTTHPSEDSLSLHDKGHRLTLHSSHRHSQLTMLCRRQLGSVERIQLFLTPGSGWGRIKYASCFPSRSQILSCHQWPGRVLLVPE